MEILLELSCWTMLSPQDPFSQSLQLYKMKSLQPTHRTFKSFLDTGPSIKCKIRPFSPPLRSANHMLVERVEDYKSIFPTRSKSFTNTSYSAIRGLRPPNQPPTSKGNKGDNNSDTRIKINSKGTAHMQAPPPRGAPGAHRANEECTAPPSPALSTSSGQGSRGRCLWRQPYRQCRKSFGVPTSLFRLGVPRNAAARRLAGNNTAKFFRPVHEQGHINGLQRGKNHAPATPQLEYGHTLKVGTQNVQGMAEILKHLQVLSMMTQQKLDILFLTETRSKSYYTYNSQGYLFIVSGSPKEAFAGITTIVAPHLRPFSCEVIQHNPRHAAVLIGSSSGTIHFHGVYAPHDKIRVDQSTVLGHPGKLLFGYTSS